MGHKLKAEEYQKHVNPSDEKHWKAISEVVNTLMMVNVQLLKNLRAKDSHENDLNAEKDDRVKELVRQVTILQTTVEDLKKESITVQNDHALALQQVQNDLALALQQIKDLRAKVEFFNQKLSTREQQLEEKDFRISLLETANYDEIMIWRISKFESQTKDARDVRYTSIFSLPFYTSKYGYKMCIRLYPLGDGMGKNTSPSLYFVRMKDGSLLQGKKPTMKLIHQLVIPDVSYCWDKIAYYLEYPIAKKKEIERRQHGDPSKCCAELMEDWLTSDRGISPKTWSTLVSTLKEINELSSVAHSIEQQLK